MNPQAEPKREVLRASPELAESAPAEEPRRLQVPIPALAAAAVAVAVTSFTFPSSRIEVPRAEGPARVAQKSVPVGAAPALEPLLSARFDAPQYEDGLVALSFPAPLAAAAVAPSTGAAAASAPGEAAPAFVSRLPRYDGPTLLAQKATRRLAAAAGFKLWGLLSLREAAAQAAPEAAAGNRNGAAILAGQLRKGSAHDVSQGMAAHWRKMSKAEQEQWAAEWEQGAVASAKAQAAAKGKVVAKTETVCVGHTDKCTFGELKVTYADGTSAVMKYDPLVFDLAGNGLRASRKVVEYDMDGDGRRERVAELPTGSGLLVLDSDRDGASGARAAELFSGYTDLDGDGKAEGYGDGFEAFNGLVRKAAADGKLPAAVLETMRLGPPELAALEKAYGLRLRVGGFGGKDLTFAEAGVSEVGLSAAKSVRQNSFDGQGTDLVRRAGAAFARADGTIGDYADLWLSPRRLWTLAFAR